MGQFRQFLEETSWEIVPQIEKSRDEEREVLCKWVKFFPGKDKETDEMKFIPLKFIVLQVIIRHPMGTEHKITWSNYHNTANGQYTYKWGIAGEKDDTYTSPERFWGWMEKNRPSVAKDVRDAFAERKSEILSTVLRARNPKDGSPMLQQEPSFKKGDLVQVTKGAMKGSYGEITSITPLNWLVVTLDGGRKITFKPNELTPMS